MSDFLAAWEIARKRFVDAASGRSQEQLNWRIHPGVLTIGEMAIHVAGVEVYFISQLLGAQLDEFGAKVARAATEGVVNDKPFPFSAEEITPEEVERALSLAESMAGTVIANPTDEVRSREIVSALGPVINGTGALARLSFHPSYHQGQVHLIATAPGFPT